MKRDVELVIRATDEASRASNSISDAVLRLTSALGGAEKQAPQTASKLDFLATMLGKVQSEYKAIDAAAAGTEAAYRKQKGTVEDLAIANFHLQVQIDAAQRQLAGMKAFTAADSVEQEKHAEKIRLVERSLVTLNAERKRGEASLARQTDALDKAGLAMQRLGSQATAAEIAVVDVALQRTLATTKALSSATAVQAEKYREQAQEARAAAAATDAQRNISALAGMSPGMPKSAQLSAAVFEEQLRLQEQQAAAAARIRAQIDPLAAAQDRYNAEVAEANALYGAGLLKSDELAQHLRRLEAQARLTGKALTSPGGGRGEKSKSALFGLKPYEVQNLAYQINDLFTQVASGTPITQAFAQQGGQIAQIFAGAGGGKFFSTIVAGAARSLPIIGLVVTALLAVGGALKSIGDQASSTRTFSGLLGASADGGMYDAKDLAATAHELDVMSGSLKDARAQVTALARAGVAEVFLQPMADSAKNMAKVFGIDVVDATKQVAEAFTQDFKAVQKLDDSLNFMTKAELEHTKALFAQGKAAEARTYAFGIFDRQMNAGAEKMTGTWAHAMQSFSRVWDNILKIIGNSAPIQAIIKWIDKMISALDVGLTKLARLKGGSALVRAEERSADLADQLTIVRARTGGGMPATVEQRRRVMLGRTAAGTRVDGKTEAQILSEMSANDADILRLQGEMSDTRAPGSEQGKKEDQVRADAAAKKAESAADKAAREAEAAANARESATDSLRSALGSLEAQADKISLAPLDARLEAVEQRTAAARKALEEARKLKIETIDGKTLAQVEKQIEVNKVLLQQEATKAFYADSIKDYEEQRTARLKAIQDLVDDGTKTEVEAAEMRAKLESELAPKMAQVAKDALAFAMALRTATPNPELEKFIAQMVLTLGRESTPGGKGSAAAAGNLSNLNGLQQQTNELLSQRNDMIQAAETLGARGKLTYEEMEAAIKKAYADTTPEIEKRIDDMRTLLEAMSLAGEIDPTAYNAWLANLDQAVLATEDLHDQLLSVADANEMLVDAGVSLWDKFFAAIEQGKNVLTAFWESLRSTLADVLSDISRMIVKAMLMRAIMSSKVGNILSGLLGDGTFKTEEAKEAADGLKEAGLILNGAAAGLSLAAKALGEAMSGSSAPTASSFVSSIFSAGVKHTGGMAGAPGVTRFEPASLWAGVQKLHNGGMPGLRQGEVRAILEDTEEVLTRQDPRHVLNGGKSRTPALNFKNVNVFDTADFLDKALATDAGERVFINHVRNNAGAFKSALGIG